MSDPENHTQVIPAVLSTGPISFVVHGSPVVQGNHRVTGGRFPKIYDSAKGLDAWRALVAMVAQQHAPAVPIDGPVCMTLAFSLPVPKSAPKRRRLAAVKKPDIDKIARAVIDALTGTLYRDDSLIVDLHVTKQLAYDGPVGCAITVSQPEQEDA